MSATSEARSDDFLRIASQFKLGALVTEGSHPATENLSDTAAQDTAAALRQLFDVDDDVVGAYREFAASGRAAASPARWPAASGAAAVSSSPAAGPPAG